MSTLEDIKTVLSQDICDWCNPNREQLEECGASPDGERYTMCNNAENARAQDVYIRIVKPLEDAAEFEARVAKKITTTVNDDSAPCDLADSCAFDKRGGLYVSCERCIMKYARIAVEAEMEAEGK